MESDKPDLNSILESARAQLEMYRRASQEDLNEPTKEMLMARSKDQVMEDVSGPLIDRAKETVAGAECVRAASRKSVSSQSAEESKEEKDSITNSEMEDDGVEVEGEESSNKNFDSSTMTLGDQQSFQNQSELTSQTTYTNIHELTGPIKDDILVVTGPKTEPSETVDSPSTVSHESQYERTTANLTTTSMTTPTIEELNKIEDVPPNQMASIRSWISDPCRESHQETIITETFPQEKTWDEAVDKSDAMKLAGAGTREGSPVRTSTKLIQEVAHRLSQLEAVGNRSPWLNQNFNEEGADCSRENNDVLSEESGSKSDESKHEVRGRGYSIFDNPPVPQNFMKIQTTMENKQVDFVQHFDDKQMNKHDTGEGRVSEKSMLEDEGFVDSKDILDSTKIIFISDQEDEQSCKPFETEDDASCMLDPSSVGRSLDVLSDLEAKPSLTDVHPIDQGNMCENVDADAESNRFLSSDTLQPSPDEEQNVVGEEINYYLENANIDNNVDSRFTKEPKEPEVPNVLKDTLAMIVETPVCSMEDHYKSPSIVNSSTKNEADKQLSPKSKNENKIDSNKQTKSQSPPQASFSPRIVQCHNKSAEPSSDPDTPKKQNKCMGRALFKMFYKSISEGKSPLPPHLTKVLQEAYANELPSSITCTTSVPLRKDHNRFNLTPNNSLVSDNLEEPCDLLIRPSLPVTPLEQIEPDISTEFPEIPNESESGFLSVISPSLTNESDLIEDTTIKSKSIVSEIIKETENNMNSQSQLIGVNKEHNETEPQHELVELQRLIMPLSDLDNLLTDEFLGISRDTQETVVSEIFAQEITEIKKSPKHDFKDSSSLSPETSVSANKKEKHSDVDSLSSVSDISLSLTSAEHLSFVKRHQIPLEYSSDLSLRSERPLTPYVSEIRCPLPDISHYLQEPRIPAAIAPPPFIPQLHAQTTRQTNVESVNPVVPVKTPPRPPPRARHQTRPKKKINFLKKLFGFNNK